MSSSYVQLQSAQVDVFKYFRDELQRRTIVFRRPGAEIAGMKHSPKFTQKPTANEAGDGKTLTIECKIQSDSEPQIAWIVNDAQVQDGGRYKLLFKKAGGADYTASLTVTDTQKKNAVTKYEVKTRNDAGESSAWVQSFLG